MKLTFYGAAKKVTGSMFLLELEDNYKILIDCGSTMEPTIPQKYGNFPFDASLVNTVFLTHAHIDHSGQIPNLYVDGFEGQVLCTAPTLDLSEILLKDSAHIHAKSIKRIESSKKKSKKYKNIESQGLFLTKQVDEAISNFVPIAFNQRFKFKENGWVTFIEAGHLLGAAHIFIELKENGKTTKIGFSGDIGRDNFQLLKNPDVFPEVDYLILESTYGDRLHEDKEDAEQMLKKIIEESCVQKQGRLIVPAFSVGRTQCLLFALNKLYENHNLKPIKVFTDSPLAKASSKIYEKHVRFLNAESKEFFAENESLFDFENLTFIENNQASKSVSDHSEPCIIISSSGMINGGRIEYHIEKNIENPYATILMIGYATEQSVGGKLLSGELESIFLRNKKLQVNASIKKIDVFSGHGDLNDLIKFAKYQNPERLKKLFLVHGEESSMINLKNNLAKEGFSTIEIPNLFQTFEI